MGKVAFFLSGLCLLPSLVFTQDSSLFRINPWIDLPVAGGGLIANFIGLGIVNAKPSVDSATAYSLDPMQVNAFDRGATRQNPRFARPSESVSDLLMNGSMALPLLLLADRRIRSEWQPVLLMYVETLGLTGSMYSWGSAIHIDRIRPMAYNSREPLERRTGGSTYNAFYSGHVASSAAATFFMVKVYSTFFPEKVLRKKWLYYGIASIPPVLTGLYRYRAGKHFPTDLIAGFGIGAAFGVLVPHLHLAQHRKIAFALPDDGTLGMAARIRF